jgi:hypothetical protein
MTKFSRLLYAGLLLAGVAFSCSKTEDVVLADVNNLGRGAYVTLEKTTNLNIDYANLANAVVSIDVKPYGPLEVEKVITYVSTNNTTATTTWKKIKEFPMTAGQASTLRVTAADLATALGRQPRDLAPGNQYVIFNEIITKDGKKFNIANTNGDLESNTGYRASFRWTATVVCPFEKAPFDSKIFTVVQDGWEDYVPGDQIEIKVTGASQITLVDCYPTGFNHKDVVVDVNAATGAATVPKVAYGSYSRTGTIYSCEGGGYVFGCTGIVDLTLTHTGGGSNFGAYKLKLKPSN